MLFHLHLAKFYDFIISSGCGLTKKSISAHAENSMLDKRVSARAENSMFRQTCISTC
jgi:hypothetical protein